MGNLRDGGNRQIESPHYFWVILADKLDKRQNCEGSDLVLNDDTKPGEI